MYMGKWVCLTNTDYDHSLTIVEDFQFSRRLSFVSGEQPRAWMVLWIVTRVCSTD